MPTENWIGFLDGRDERERKEFLPDSFVITKSIKEALNPALPFICGRRGAGKSTIAYELGILKENGKSKYDSYMYITRDDYELLQEILVSDIIKNPYLSSSSQEIDSFFFEIWNYIINLIRFQCAIQLSSKGILKDNEIEKIVEFMKGNGGIDISPIYTAVDKVCECLSQIKDESAPATKFILALKGLKSKPGFVSAMKRAQEIFERYSAIVAIDTLEEYDLDEWKIHSWRGMCRSIKDFHSFGKNGNMFIKCFLPAELTEYVFKENLAKYSDFSVYLQWNYMELIEFIAKRYSIFLRENGFPQESNNINSLITSSKKVKSMNEKRTFWREKFWNRYFQNPIRNNYGWMEDSAAYIIRHTQKRPREIISCMNSIIDKSIENNEFQEGKIPIISEKSIINGIHNSDNLCQLLSDNLSIFNLSRSHDISRSMRYVAETLLSNELCVFKGSKLKNFSKRAFSLLTQHTNLSETPDIMATELLMRSGLLGTVIAVNEWLEPEETEKCKYYLTQFEYCIPGQVSVNDRTICAVHPMLADHLHLKSPDKGVVYHLSEDVDLIPNLSLSKD